MGFLRILKEWLKRKNTFSFGLGESKPLDPKKPNGLTEAEVLCFKNGKQLKTPRKVFLIFFPKNYFKEDQGA